MIKDFEKKNPKITVKPTFVAYEALHDKIVTSAPAGTYDVVLMDVIWPAEFASKGLITDVTTTIPGQLEERDARRRAQHGGVQRQVLRRAVGSLDKLFFYNTAMLAKVGATPDDVKTWDGVLAVAKKLKAAGVVKYPLSWSWSQAEALICDYAQILGAFGGSSPTPTGNLTVNKAAGRPGR